MTLNLNTSSMKINLINNIILNNDKDWQTILNINPYRSVFQSFDWTKRMEHCLEAYVAKPILFEFSDGTKIIWSMLQRSVRNFFSCIEAMPLGFYGRPIIQGEWSPEKGREMLQHILTERCLEMQYVENPIHESLSFLLPKGVTQEIRSTETHLLDLAESWDVMWEKVFSPRIRNQIRKAEKEGLKVRQGLSKRDIDDFYILYELSTKGWGYSSPPYSKKFFLNLMDNTDNTLKLLLVDDQDKTVAGGIFIEDVDFILYWFGVMDKIAERKFPMYLLLSQVISEAINKRKKYLNMGASGNLEGVRKFKELWGARPVSYNIIVFKRYQLIRQLVKDIRILDPILRRFL